MTFYREIGSLGDTEGDLIQSHFLFKVYSNPRLVCGKTINLRATNKINLVQNL